MGGWIRMVNIEDFTSNPSENKLDDIFQKQASLMNKYHEIEKQNGFPVFKAPVNLHGAQAQAKIKDFAWRITEEIGEALEALAKEEDEHFKEELSDALHFLVEMSILVGYKPTHTLEELFKTAMYNNANPESEVEQLNEVYYRTGILVQELGKAMNCLKNKPWKTSQMITDVTYFNLCMAKTWEVFIDLCDVGGLGADSLYDLYFRKNKVNQFRQRSGY